MRYLHECDFEEDEPSKASKKPLVGRKGRVSVELLHMDRRRIRYLKDIYTTLVDTNWRWTLISFFMAFIVCWAFYGAIYFAIIKIRGNSDSESPCLQNVRTFTAAFMLSLETQHTIGYGFRYVTEECPEAVVTLCFQSITGVMIQAFMVGVLFAKLTRPKKRLNTLIFSRIASFCMRDGKLCLMFRVGNMRKSFIIGASVKAQLIRKYVTEEGEVLPFFQREISVMAEGGSNDLFFSWPINIVHLIDEKSPFYEMSAVDLINADFELVVYLEGTAESTGTSVQARHSYSPSNMLWGHHFNNMISYDDASENYKVDFSLFNSTTEVQMPLCSARDLKLYEDATRHVRNGSYPLTSPNHTVIRLQPDLFTKNEIADAS